MGLELNLPEDYKLSEGEIDNIVYLTCKYTVQWPMRQVDLQVCKMMAGLDKPTPPTGSKAVGKLLEVTCDYLWDHVCGEPDDFTAKSLFEHMEPALKQWYSSTTPEDRAKTE